MIGVHLIVRNGETVHRGDDEDAALAAWVDHAKALAFDDELVWREADVIRLATVRREAG